jgi:hypothetical protein
MESWQKQKEVQMGQQVSLPAELPTAGTPLNPVEEAWAFNKKAAAAPVEQLASSMQQGE